MTDIKFTLDGYTYTVTQEDMSNTPGNVLRLIVYLCDDCIDKRDTLRNIGCAVSRSKEELDYIRRRYP